MTDGFNKWLERNDITLDWEFAGGVKFHQCSCNGIFVTADTALNALLLCYERNSKMYDKTN
jgi:hypothetical protein